MIVNSNMSFGKWSRIRSSVIAEENLCTYGHNVKIVSANGTVTEWGRAVGSRESRDRSAVAFALNNADVKVAPGTQAPSLAALLERTWTSTWMHNSTSGHARLMVNRITRESGHLLGNEVTFDRLEEECLKWLKDGMAPATVNRRMAAVRTALGEAHARGLLAVLPKVPKYPEKNFKERYVTPEEEARVLAWLNGKAAAEALDPEGTGAWTYMAALTSFLIDTGCRLGEALNVEPASR